MRFDKLFKIVERLFVNDDEAVLSSEQIMEILKLLDRYVRPYRGRNTKEPNPELPLDVFNSAINLFLDTRFASEKKRPDMQRVRKNFAELHDLVWTYVASKRDEEVALLAKFKRLAR